MRAKTLIIISPAYKLRSLPAKALLVVLILLSCTYDTAVSSQESSSVDYQSQRDQHHLYTDIIPANTTDSLERIRHISLKFYEYIYDSVPGRRQLGVVGEDVRAIFPEAVEVIAQYPVQKRGRAFRTFLTFQLLTKTSFSIMPLQRFRNWLSHMTQWRTS